MRPVVKVCGMTEANNIAEVCALQPSYIGLIFYKNSKRDAWGKVRPDMLHVCNAHTKKIGVFVDAEIDIMANLVSEYSLDGIQLHGNESVAYTQTLRDRLPKILLIKALAVNETINFYDYASYEPFVDYFLLDTKGPLRGGNGISFDWNILNRYPFRKPFFLSGGISPTHAEDIKKLAQKMDLLYGVDVNSRFEIAPGIKDINLLRNFLSGFTEASV